MSHKHQRLPFLALQNKTKNENNIAIPKIKNQGENSNYFINLKQVQIDVDDNKPYLVNNIKPFISPNIKTQAEDNKKLQNESNLADEQFIKILQKSLKEAIDENEKVSKILFYLSFVTY